MLKISKVKSPHNNLVWIDHLLIIDRGLIAGLEFTHYHSTQLFHTEQDGVSFR